MNSHAQSDADSVDANELHAPNSMTRSEMFGFRLAVLLGIGGVIFLARVLLPVSGGLELREISGGSMAERILGQHLQIQCGDCGFRFNCDNVPGFAPDETAVCPNCGFQIRLEDRMNRGADNGIIAMGNRSPRRWQVIAFEPWPGMSEAKHLNKDALVIKRVVALPGERVAIRGGDLFINDARWRKSLAEQLRMRVLVHDDNFRPPLLPRRWFSPRADSGWQQTKLGYRFEPGDSDSESRDWIWYRHWRCMPVPIGVPRTEEAPIKDNYGYNQGPNGRQLFPMDDLMMTCRMRLSGHGVFSLSAFDGKVVFQVDLSTNGNLATLSKDGVVVQRLHLGLPLADQQRSLVMSLFDRQLLFAIDGRVVIRHAYESRNSRQAHSRRPLGIGAEGLTAEVTALRLHRDIYYLDRQNIGRRWEFQRQLGPNEFFVLGDNVPISQDSRHWGAISRDKIAGRLVRKSRSPND